MWNLNTDRWHLFRWVTYYQIFTTELLNTGRPTSYFDIKRPCIFHFERVYVAVILSCGVPRIFVRGGGFNKFSWGSGGGYPLVRGSGGSSNLLQEISFHIVKFSSFFGTLRLFMTTTNLFFIANVKKLRTGGSFRILLPFFWTSWGVGVLNSAVFNSFHYWV